ncbi:MAG: outer membrane lipoprotein LolB [Tepidimonas sp.]|uniref:outer membrane lipoprotein LolB n=1 Tax=Tepidimonas sp. TaxID=2002775 RepID=UPI00259F7E14|nr:outer membrane lipoprotein LolB [Tepidimonas sp.]MDM7457667.1 outer membrane lipoprotein LolB [Tepidimonas sp.]
MRPPCGRRALVLALAASALLAGCATPPAPTTAPWSGRLALTLATQPPQRWTASFELEGTPAQGALRLYTPLGQTLATLRWDGAAAWLDRGDEPPRRYDSLETLTADLTGAPLPVAALFAWLGGSAQDVPGWEVDLTQQPQGRLRARRTAPPPAADLRLLWQP